MTETEKEEIVEFCHQGLKRIADILEAIKKSIDNNVLEHRKANEMYDRALKVREQEAQQTDQDTVSTPPSELTSEELTEEKYIVRATEVFPQELENLLDFTIEGTTVKIKPKRYLGSENFAKIARLTKEAGGEYVSAGKASHFRIPLEKLR